MCGLLVHPVKQALYYFSSSIGNWIEGLTELIRSSSIYTATLGARIMKVSSTYFRHPVGFSGTVSKGISSNYSVYMFTHTADNGEPIAKPFKFGICQNGIIFSVDRTLTLIRETSDCNRF